MARTTRWHIPTRRRYQRHSKDLRDRVVYLRYIFEYKTTKIAALLDMSLRSVQRVLQKWEEIGTVIENPRQAGRPKKMSQEQLKVCLPTNSL
jgi:transposase